MKKLTLKDTRLLLNSVQFLYSLKSLDTFGRDTLSILEQLVPTETSLMVTSRFDLSDATWQSLSQDFEHLIEDLTPAIYRTSHQNPLIQNLSLTLKGIHKFSDFVDREEFQRTKAYQEVMKPIGVDDMMAIVIYDRDRHQVPRRDEYIPQYVLYRPWQKFTERDRLILNLFQPHLTQVYQTVQQLQQLQQQLSQLQETLDRSGVIFLDGLGQVQLMTSQAAQWLQSYFPSSNGFSIFPEQLHSWVKHQLARFKAIDDDLFTPCLPLHVQKENRQLTIRLVIDRPGGQYLLLLAEEQLLSWLTVLEFLGLSRREAEILACIIQGQDNKAIAVKLDIKIDTVRKHLENIYRKLNVQSRTEAIALALEKAGCLPRV